MKFEVMLARQLRDEMLVCIRLLPAQLVIEMNDSQHNPQLAAQFQQKPQQRHRINPAGDGHANAVPGPQHLLPPDVGKHALRQWVHGNMVPQEKTLGLIWL